MGLTKSQEKLIFEYPPEFTGIPQTFIKMGIDELSGYINSGPVDFYSKSAPERPLGQLAIIETQTYPFRLTDLKTAITDNYSEFCRSLSGILHRLSTEYELDDYDRFTVVKFIVLSKKNLF